MRDLLDDWHPSFQELVQSISKVSTDAFARAAELDAEIPESLKTDLSRNLAFGFCTYMETKDYSLDSSAVTTLLRILSTEWHYDRLQTLNSNLDEMYKFVSKCNERIKHDRRNAEPVSEEVVKRLKKMKIRLKKENKPNIPDDYLRIYSELQKKTDFTTWLAWNGHCESDEEFQLDSAVLFQFIAWGVFKGQSFINFWRDLSKSMSEEPLDKSKGFSQFKLRRQEFNPGPKQASALEILYSKFGNGRFKHQEAITAIYGPGVKNKKLIDLFKGSKQSDELFEAAFTRLKKGQYRLKF